MPCQPPAKSNQMPGHYQKIHPNSLRSLQVLADGKLAEAASNCGSPAAVRANAQAAIAVQAGDKKLQRPEVSIMAQAAADAAEARALENAAVKVVANTEA
mmetsp:Transcript_13546/g.40969  ORF Transcript_13546/g.40969 Transcript_13546/m.40969 type:complete len:100 (-) Transcript_13546:520-819(-)